MSLATTQFNWLFSAKFGVFFFFFFLGVEFLHFFLNLKNSVSPIQNDLPDLEINIS
jgi:hypothetical protein